MKKILLFLAFCLVMPMMYGQVADEGQYWDINHTSNPIVRYKLYPTFNRYNFLNLDTRRGSITIVQYDVQGDNEFEYYLGQPEADIPDSLMTNGRYELYPTRNNYTFILLDQITGDSYHVQWSIERKNRFIRKIRYSFGQ